MAWIKDAPNPGSKAAQDLGCFCPVLDNGHGIRPDPSMIGWVVTEDCPVHDVDEDESNES